MKNNPSTDCIKMINPSPGVLQPSLVLWITSIIKFDLRSRVGQNKCKWYCLFLSTNTEYHFLKITVWVIATGV
jgi:hypothetical protein